MIRRIFTFMLVIAASAPIRAQERAPTVLAASSMQEAMTDAANAWARDGHARPVIAFAASSALARQIGAGAPADLFVSADIDWMDLLQRRGLLASGTRAVLARGQLVVVARPGAPSVAGKRGASLGRALAAGPLAMADPASVPAGRYGQQALARLGAWAIVAPHVVRAENVRAALALVERGAAPYAIVYATDVRASTQVRVAGTFPAASHAAIVYPIARMRGSRNPAAEAFRRYLLSAAGQAVLARHGFGAR